MKKGQKKKKWTIEQKLEIVHKHLDDHISVRTLAKEYETDTGMICRWTKEYLSGGEAAFEPKTRPGNKFAALHRSKNLSELERLRLLVAKQEIEIARLKKRTGWKELVQTRSTLLDKMRIRNYRRNERKISNSLSLSTHGSQ